MNQENVEAVHTHTHTHTHTPNLYRIGGQFVESYSLVNKNIKNKKDGLFRK